MHGQNHIKVAGLVNVL